MSQQRNKKKFIQNPKFDDHEDIKTGIREILLRLEPLVKVSAGNAPLESMMGFLEELDDSSFEKYLLVKHIKSKLQNSLLDLVQSEVQLQCRDTQLTPEKMKIVAPAILSKLMTSAEMEECMNSLHEEIGGAASDMCANFDRELVLMSHSRDNQHRPLSRNTHSSLSDSLSSTWTQSVFIQPNQYAKIADKLNPYRASEDRIEALNTLLVSQVSECISVHCWPAIKEGLQAALLDTNAAVAGLALRIYSKMLANVTPFCTKEAFVSMTSTIIGLYKDRTRNYQLPAISHEISFKKRPNQNLLQICRLITMTCRELPRYWSRYPTTVLENIMQAMLEMVTLKSKGQKSLSPIHLVSLVDPKAHWLKAWLHGNLGRQLFFHWAIQTHDNLFFKTAMHHLLVNLDKDTFPLLSRSSGRKKGLISNSLVSFAFFTHNLHVNCLALRYHYGRQMFPLNLPNHDQIDAGFLFKSLVHFVTNANSASQQNAAKIITQALVSLDNVNFWIKDEDILNMIITPLLNWSQVQNAPKAANLFKLLQVLFKTPKAGGELLFKHKNFDFILNFTGSLLQSLTSLSHQFEQVLLEALEVCKIIGKSHLCIANSSSLQDFIKSLDLALLDVDELVLKTPTNSMANVNLQPSEVKRKFVQVLNCFASTPLGMQNVSQYENLMEVLLENEPLDRIVLISSSEEILNRLKNEAFDPELEADDIDLKNLAIVICESENIDFLPPSPNANAYKVLNFVLNVSLDLRLSMISKMDLEANLKQVLENCKNDEGILIKDKISLEIQSILLALKGIKTNGESPRKNPTNSQEDIKKLFEQNSNLSTETLARFLLKCNEDNPIKRIPDTSKTLEMKKAAEMFEIYAKSLNLNVPKEAFEHCQDWNSRILTLLFNGNSEKVSKICLKSLDVVKIGHFVELILLEKMPLLWEKLTKTNISIHWIVKKWLNQSFLNILEFHQIINFFLLPFFYSENYVIYTCVSLFKHLEGNILRENQDQFFTLCEFAPRFNLTDYLAFMNQLEHNYAKYIK